MKTHNIEVCDAMKYIIDCEKNDQQDIRCGGPNFLGYDFVLSTDEKKDKSVARIKILLTKYKQPLLSISTLKTKDYPVKNLWSWEKVEKCIKKGY